MTIERVLGAVDAEEVQALTVRAFGLAPLLEPPSSALSESVETIAADFAGHGGLLLRGPDGHLLASCRLRRQGTAWVLRRCAVDPGQARRGLGRRLVQAALQWACDEQVLRTHVGVRHARPGSRAFWESLGFRLLAEHGFWTELVRPVPLVLDGPPATHELGRRLAGELRAGDLLVLSGPLGAGKTALTQGIGVGLGVRGTVTSPTFVLARVHPGPLPLVHVDAYRLRDSGSRRLELDDLDLDASLPDSVTVVEWGDGLAEGLSEARLEVALDRPEEDSRTLVSTPHGRRWSAFG